MEQWPTQFASLVRVQKQLRIYRKLQGSVKGGMEIILFLACLPCLVLSNFEMIAARDMLQLADMGEFERYDTGPRRNPIDFFFWAGVDIQNNWGPGNFALYIDDHILSIVDMSLWPMTERLHEPHRPEQDRARALLLTKSVP